MLVLKDTLVDLDAAPRTMTQEAMQKDFDFAMAEIIVKKLYEKELISNDELHRISELNREKFSPFYGDIMM